MQANRVMYDGLYTFALRILNIVCAAGLGILTARMLGPAGKGIYALPSIEAGLVVSAFSGLGSAISYFMLNRRPGASLWKPATATAAFFMLAGAIAIVPIALLAGQPWAAIPAIISLPSSAAINMASGYAVGIKRVRYSTTVNVAVTLITFAFMALGLFLVARDARVAIAVWLTASTLVGAVAAIAMLLDLRKREGSDTVTVREFAKFSVKIGSANLVALLNYRADLYIVAMLTNAASLGMYTVAVSAAESLLVPTQVAALVTSPHIGSLDRPAAARITARCVRNNMLIALVVCGVLFAFASPVVHLLYGAAFAPVVRVLQILLVGVFALSLGSPMSSYFTLKLGRPEVPLWLAGASAAVCIGVSLALVPTLGMAGAALASTAAYVAGQAAAIWYFSRTAGVSPAQILVPTGEDLALYKSFAGRVLADGRRLLHRTAQ